MSSPIHHAKDLDPALMYAPQWARDARPAPSRHPAPPVEWLLRHRRFDNYRFSGDRAVVEMRRRLRLEPERVPEPPPSFASDRSIGRTALTICGAAGLAAVIAWAIVVAPGARWFESRIAQASVSLAPTALKVDKQDSLRGATAAQTALPDEQPAANEPPPPAIRVAATPPATEQSAALTSTPSGPESSALRLNDAEIAALVKRGQSLLANGDATAARLLLLRAADAGSATAALVLGTTFDPLIQRRSVVGGETDAAQARKWYQRAIELGSEAASQQLAKLAQAGE